MVIESDCFRALAANYGKHSTERKGPEADLSRLVRKPLHKTRQLLSWGQHLQPQPPSSPSRPERLRHKVHKRPDPRRCFVLRRVDGVDVCIRCAVLRQHLHHLVLRQVFAEVPFGAQQDAVAVQRPLHGDAAIVGGQVAARFDRLGLALLAACEFEHTIGLAPLADADEIVARQIGRGFGLAMARQVVGRCTQQALVARDLSGNHAGVGRWAKADAHIKRIVAQRWRIDRELQLHIDLWVLLHKAADQRPHVAAAKAQRGIDAQEAAGGGAAGTELLFQIGHLGQDTAGVAQHGFAFHREVHAARGAVDQRHTQARLHLRQAFAHCSRGDAHFARGSAQTSGHGQGGKKAQISGLQARFHC